MERFYRIRSSRGYLQADGSWRESPVRAATYHCRTVADAIAETCGVADARVVPTKLKQAKCAGAWKQVGTHHRRYDDRGRQRIGVWRTREGWRWAAYDSDGWIVEYEPEVTVSTPEAACDAADAWLRSKEWRLA